MIPTADLPLELEAKPNPAGIVRAIVGRVRIVDRQTPPEPRGIVLENHRNRSTVANELLGNVFVCLAAGKGEVIVIGEIPRKERRVPIGILGIVIEDGSRKFLWDTKDPRS
jgi:hypothetical protein